MEMVMFEQWFVNTLQNLERKTPELRDLFAMNALNGILSNGDFRGSKNEYAEQAYGFADAMLEARKKN